MAIGNNLTNNLPNSLVVGAGRTNDSYLFLVAGNATTDAFTVNYQGICTYATSMTGSSDRRLKTNITPLEKSIDKIMKLNGVTFNWDKTVRPSAPTTLQYGFIAQEIEKVIPELVSEDSDGYKTVNYIGVIPVLTQAMQEQQKEIEQLKDENKKLNETVEALLKRVEALEKK